MEIKTIIRKNHLVILNAFLTQDKKVIFDELIFDLNINDSYNIIRTPTNFAGSGEMKVPI